MQSPRILFIPEERDDGTSERTPVLMRILKRHYVVVGLPSLWDRIIYDTERRKAPRYVLYFVERGLTSLRGLWLARNRRVQLVFCEAPHHALVGLWISRVLGLPCVFDSHGNALLFAQSMNKGNVYTFLSSRLDRFLGRRVSALITVSQRDAEAYVRMGVPPSRIHVIPTSADLKQIDLRAGPDSSGPERAVTEGRKSLLFFGSLKYAPNLEAFRFINERLAPYLETERIPCEIRIAGRDAPRTDLHPSIRPLGFVEDIYAWIRRSDLCVVPVWKGVGILTKVVDIMASGTPAVLSSFAMQGIPEIRDGVHAVIASSEDEFPERVAFALRHPERMSELAVNARRLVADRYDWGVYEPVLEGLLTSLIGQPRVA